MTSDALTSYVATFVDGLVSSGIADVVISPGSRSTPLALTMAECDELNVYTNIDERSAAFFALGIAKAKQHPVVLLCTSGTAAANYFPALVEAHYSRVPLVVVTADRPHELREVGAPQAIDQVNLYGKYAKWFVDVAIPESSVEALRYIKQVAKRAVHVAERGGQGVTHVNFPLREPLLPNLAEVHNFFEERREERKKVSERIGSQADVAYVEQLLERAEKPLFICGQQISKEGSREIVALADMLNIPILADPLSNIRTNKLVQGVVMDSYDTFLKNERVAEELAPDLIVRFGGMPVSKTTLKFITNYAPENFIMVDHTLDWRDPTGTITDVIVSHEEFLCRSLREQCENITFSKNWLSKWMNVQNITSDLLQQAMDNTEELDEGKVVVELQKALPEQSLLFVGNSMPIRDVDTFLRKSSKSLDVLANRGANGIDGVVSAALGASTTYHHSVLLIGDVSFYHDLNGLLAAHLNGLNLTVVLVNNDGGGIFSFLPQAKEEKHFELLFGTPLGIDFSNAVKAYHGSFHKASNWADFRHYLEESFRTKGVTVIEIETVRTKNVETHRSMWKDIEDVLNEEKEK
jgi:2-succinyl-5-enolpyruvyl-6-hydroxy-3-cyclohexene-1-carboxylate synthase